MNDWRHTAGDVFTLIVLGFLLWVFVLIVAAFQ